MNQQTTAVESGTNKINSDRDELIFQHPAAKDGQKVWQLVKDTGVLDLNSAYCYILLCDHFKKTCMTAWQGNELVGFVSAYVLPETDDTLFIWQVAVSSKTRGKGVGKRLLKKLLNSDAGKAINRIQATVSPSNKASLALFESLARELKTELKISEGFSSDMFPGGGHEQEDLLTIGPYKQN